MCHLSRGEGCRAAGDCKGEHDKSDATHHPSHTDEVRNTELSRARRASSSSSSRRPPFLRGPVTFSVTNKGKIPHDFKIAGKKTPAPEAGQERRAHGHAQESKNAYVCGVPGHAALGMKGTLTAK
jgi:hypothetical protein